MADLSIDGETFRVEVEGSPERPTVLLSNPLGTDLSFWDRQMPALLEHFRVVRYDARGHGGSPISGAPYGIDRLGRDALAILDALEIESAHVLGLSMGGAVGQWLLVNAPGRVARAVLANTAARPWTPAVWNERIEAVLARGMDSLVDATMERWFSARFRRSEPDAVERVASVFRNIDPRGYAGCCAALRDMDLRAAIHAIDAPVLVVTGTDDPVTSDSDIATMLSAIKGVRHVELACRHISNIEADEDFTAAVIGFLTAPLPARTAAKGRATRVPVRRPRRVAAARSPLKARPAKVPVPRPRAASRKAAAKRAVATTKPRAASGARTAARKPVTKSTARTAGASAKAGVKKTPSPPAASKARPAPARPTPRSTASRPAPARAAAPAKTLRGAASKAKAAKAPTSAKRTPTAAKKATAKRSAGKTATSSRSAATGRRKPTKRPGRPTGRRS